MSNVFILCNYKNRKNSAYALEQALKEHNIQAYRCTPKTPPKKRIESATHLVGWGVTTLPVWWRRVRNEVRIINWPTNVAMSSHKVTMFENMDRAHIPHLPYTTQRPTAREWMDAGEGVVVRALTRSHSGKGIQLLSPGDTIPRAPLYTKLYTGNRVREYRVYVVGGRAVDMTEKQRYSPARLAEIGVDGDSTNERLIRTHANGWVFARGNLRVNEAAQRRLKQLAEQAAESIHLGVCAVDLITETFTTRTFDDGTNIRNPQVVETNSAPSLTGDSNTCSAIARGLIRHFNIQPQRTSAVTIDFSRTFEQEDVNVS